MTDYRLVLDTYSLEEILEMNDLTEEDILRILVTSKIIDLPDVIPLEFE